MKYKIDSGGARLAVTAICAVTVLSLAGCKGDSSTASGFSYDVSGDPAKDGLEFRPSLDAYELQMKISEYDQAYANSDVTFYLEGSDGWQGSLLEAVDMVGSQGVSSHSQPYSQAITKTLTTNSDGELTTYIQSTKSGDVTLKAYTYDSQQIFSYNFSFKVDDKSNLELVLDSKPEHNSSVPGNGKGSYDYTFRLQDEFGNPYPGKDLDVSIYSGSAGFEVLPTDGNGIAIVKIFSESAGVVLFSMSYAGNDKEMINSPVEYIGDGDSSSGVGEVISNVINDVEGDIASIVELDDGSKVLTIEKADGSTSEVSIKTVPVDNASVDIDVSNSGVSTEGDISQQVVITETDSKGNVTENIVTEIIVADPNDATSTIATTVEENVTKDASGNVTERVTEVKGVNESGDSITVREEYAANSVIDLGESTDNLSLPDGITGEVTRNVVVNENTGTVVEEIKMVSEQEDGSVITAEKKIDSNVTADNAQPSLAGELTGAVEAINIVQTDASGAVLQEQTQVSGENELGETVVASTNYEAEGTLIVDGEEVQGAVSQTSIEKRDSSNNVVAESYDVIMKDDGTASIASPQNSVELGDGTLAEVNLAINANSSDAAIEAVASLFEREYGIDFDGWNVTRRVIPLIMSQVVDYDRVLKNLKAEGGTVLKDMLGNYPISAHNDTVTVISTAGGDNTVVLSADKEMVLDGRLETITFLHEIGSPFIAKLENGRTYLMNNANFSGGFIQDLGLSSDYWYDATQDGLDAKYSYLKNVSVVSMFTTTTSQAYTGGSYYVTLQEVPGQPKRLSCLGSSSVPESGVCNDINQMNEGGANPKTWLQLYPLISPLNATDNHSHYSALLDRINPSLTTSSLYSRAFTAVAEEGTLYCDPARKGCKWYEGVTFAHHNIDEYMPVQPINNTDENGDALAKNFQLIDSGKYLYLYDNVNATENPGLRVVDINSNIITPDGSYLVGGASSTGTDNWNYRIEYKAFAPWDNFNSARKYGGLRVVAPDDSVYYIAFTDTNESSGYAVPHDIDQTEQCSISWFGLNTVDKYPANTPEEIAPYIDAWNNMYSTTYTVDDVDWSDCYRFSQLSAFNIRMKDKAIMFFGRAVSGDKSSELVPVAGLERIVDQNKMVKGYPARIINYDLVYLFENRAWYMHDRETIFSTNDSKLGRYGEAIGFEMANGSSNRSVIQEAFNEQGFGQIYGTSYLEGIEGFTTTTYGSYSGHPLKYFSVQQNAAGYNDFSFFAGNTGGAAYNGVLRDALSQINNVFMSTQEPGIRGTQTAFYYYDKENSQFGLRIIRGTNDIDVDSACLALIKPDSQYNADETQCEDYH